MRGSNLPLAVLASILSVSLSYTLRGSVSWVVDSSDVVEDSSEEVAPALLVDGGGLWKQAYPSSSVLRESAESPVEEESNDVTQLSSRLFSYRLEKKKSRAAGGGGGDPPPHQELARTARYIAHNSDWGHLSTISTQDTIKGFPFGNIFSVSDGPVGNSTGVLYFYVTPMDNSVADLKSNPRASLTFSEAEGEFCRKKRFDPEDPRCARLTLTGKMVEVPPEELVFAKEAVFSRHPDMVNWPVGHKWFFMKLDLIQIWLQDWTGGTSVVPLEEYFKATPF